MNIDAPGLDLAEAEQRVHQMQTKLHQWAAADPSRRFDDLYNLVYDPAFLVVAGAGCGAIKEHGPPESTE